MKVALAIVGAGPYGLGLAAHARGAGISCQLFGRPMSFWREGMPEGMPLRSPPALTLLSTPGAGYTLEAHLEARGGPGAARGPVPRELFLEYAEEFRRREGLECTAGRVDVLAREGDRFVLQAGGERHEATDVVLATGPALHPWVPPQVSESLARSSWRHSSEPPGPEGLAGARILVLGGGQSAMEAAALSARAGARVTVVARARRLRVVDSRGIPGRGAIALVHRSTAVLRRLPAGLRRPLARLLAPTTVETWSHGVLRGLGVGFCLGARDGTFDEGPGGIHLRLADGRGLAADRVVCGTGYRVELSRHPLLAGSSLLAALRTHDGLPVLDDRGRSSVEGLWFAGLLAWDRFGPASNFVFGAPAQCRAIIDRGVARR
ncbi:MAG: FAD-dependent oxidoreductase [Planctomycetes bacterium]|nr:FAD-dependent oxidoreductase [Planctomycetota bacterium]